MDRALKRICGFAMWKRLPDESAFSRAFAEFALAGLAERAHTALVKDTLGQVLVGHISRDGAAIETREKPAQKAAAPVPGKVEGKEPEIQAKPRRGRPGKGEVRAPSLTKIERQLGQNSGQMLAELPRGCDRGTKCNAPQRVTGQCLDARQPGGDPAAADDGTAGTQQRPGTYPSD